MPGVAVCNNRLQIVDKLVLSALFLRQAEEGVGGFAVVVALGFKKALDAVGNGRVGVVCQVRCVRIKTVSAQAFHKVLLPRHGLRPTSFLAVVRVPGCFPVRVFLGTTIVLLTETTQLEAAHPET